jgi:hypothetical protein
MKKLVAASVLTASLLAGVTQVQPAFAATVSKTSASKAALSAQKIKEAKAQVVKSMNEIKKTVASYQPTLKKFNPLKEHGDEMRQAFRDSGLTYFWNETNEEYYKLTTPVSSINSNLSADMVALSQKQMNAYAAKGNTAGVKAVEAQFKKYASNSAKQLNYQGLVQLIAKFDEGMRSSALSQVQYNFTGDLTTIVQYYEENGALKANIDSLGFDIIKQARTPLLDYKKYTTVATEVNTLRNQSKATSFDQINLDLTDWLIAKPRSFKNLNDLMPAHLQTEIANLKEENDNLKTLLQSMQALKVKYLGE